MHMSYRRRKLRIPPPGAKGCARHRPLHCSSSPHETRFAGLSRGPRIYAALAARRRSAVAAEPLYGHGHLAVINALAAAFHSRYSIAAFSRTVMKNRVALNFGFFMTVY